MDELAALVPRLLPGAQVLHAEQLPGSPRSVVHRVRLRYSDGEEATVVTKAYVSSRDGYVREAAALGCLPSGASASMLLGEDSTRPAVAMRDLGSGASLADALLGGDATRAGDLVEAWARAIAGLHIATLTARPAFEAALQARSGDVDVEVDPMPNRLRRAADELAVLANDARLEWSIAAGQELVELSGRFDDSGRSALSPTDACPDNNIMLGDQLYLLDFEGASFWHVAWDAAYLTVPWPSCWCAWRLPDSVSAAAVRAYRKEMSPVMPYVSTSAFDDDVAAATVAWAFLSMSWLLPSALQDDQPLAGDSHLIAPRRRAMIVHRLTRATESAQRAALPALGAVAAMWVAGLQRRWPTSALQLAPAFR